jgi:hypothetical protein
MTLLAALLLTQAAPDPTPEALALGRRLAEAGTLSALLPIVVAKDREEVIGEHPEWSDADKAAFRTTADQVAADGIGKLMDATGRSYARKLNVEELRTLVAFNEGAAAKRWRDAMPAAIVEGMTAIGEFDFKKNARAAFCAKTGKACEKK